MSNDVALREVRDDDLPLLFEHQLDPEAVRMAAFPSRTREAFMQHWTTVMRGEGVFVRVVEHRGVVAGNMMAWRDDDGWNVGYWIDRSHWGKGVATAALSQLVALVPHRPLVAHVVKHNVASIRVLEKCGFTITGDGSFSVEGGKSGEEYVLTLGPAAAPD